MILQSDTGTVVAVPTTCKTWGCIGCRDRVIAEFKKRIVFGVSTLGPCWFITVTYRMVEDVARMDAAGVAKDWRRFLKLLKLEFPLVKWLRVIESTKKGQPHLHLIMGDMKASGEAIRRFVKSAWTKVTGSFIVDVEPVLGAKGAARYLAKYLRKEMLNWEVLFQLGFRRRFSCSNDWPRGRLGIRGSVENRWVKTEFVPAGSPKAEWAEKIMVATRSSSLVEVVGPEFLVEEYKKAEIRRFVNLGKAVSNEIVRA